MGACVSTGNRVGGARVSQSQVSGPPATQYGALMQTQLDSNLHNVEHNPKRRTTNRRKQLEPSAAIKAYPQPPIASSVHEFVIRAIHESPSKVQTL